MDGLSKSHYQGGTVQRMARYDGADLELPSDFPECLAQALGRTAEQFPELGTIFVTAPEHAEFLSYPMLLDRSRRLLTGLRQHGLTPGDHVVLYGSESLHFFAMFWACALGGLRPLLMARPTDPSARDAIGERLRHATRLLGNTVVLCDEAAPAELPSDTAVLDVTAHLDLPPSTDIHQPDPDDVALLMMSSGSTGLPKLIQLTTRGLMEFAAGTPSLLPIRPGDTTLNWLPLDHSGAFLLYHLLGVFVGGTNVHAPTELVLADPLTWLDLMSEYRVNHSWSPNFGYRLVNEALSAHPDRHWDLSSISSLVSGGEQITLAVMTEFVRATAPFGIRPDAFVPAWGMTETVTAISFGGPGLAPNIHRVRRPPEGALEWVDDNADPDDCLAFVAVGVPAPGASLRVVDDDQMVLPEGRIGRLQVRSARVTPGYFGNPSADRAAFVAGDGEPRAWLDTGDLAFGKDGQIVITGRQGDRIVLNGQNHYAHDIETVVAAVAGVAPRAVAACGVPNERTGSEELVVFVSTDGHDPGQISQEIRRRLFARLGMSARIVAVTRAAFPRTPSGKIQRSVLRQRFVDGEFASEPVPPAVPQPLVGLPNRVRAVFQEVLGAAIDERAPFHELGIDSLTLVRLHARLRRELGIDFGKVAMLEHPSIAALSSHLRSLDSAPAPQQPPPAVETGAALPVAIVGMAARLPGAGDLDTFWANLAAGVVSVRRFDPNELAAAGMSADDGFVPVTGALSDIDKFDADFFGISPAEAELTDPAHRLFLECCYHALEHGGYAGAVGGERIGVFAGSGMNLYTHQNYLLNNILDAAHDPIADIQIAIGTQPDFLATRVAYRLGLTGPAIGVQTACSTSLVAVHLACQALRSGDADLALAGAAAIHVPEVNGYHPYPGSILSPTGQCRAFDADADGTVGGNGVAAVLLKRLDRALADGDTIHAVILGSAVNNDGRGKVGFTAPSVGGQADVIERALDEAGVPAESITYFEAHGTGTPLGDPVELRAAAQALRNRTQRVGFCTVGSVKSNIGHLDSCAGMAGLTKTVLMLSHRTLVPLANLRQPNPELELDGSPFVLGTELKPWRTDGGPRRAGVSALGVGGTNAHVILEEAPASSRRASAPPTLRVLPLSAAHPQALVELTDQVREQLRRHPDLPVADLLATAALGRPHLRHRIAVTGDTATELADALGAAPAGEPPVNGLAPVTFAFTGQGTARLGMAGELYATFPAFRRVLDECERVYADRQGGSLLALLCGPDEQRIWPTDSAQSALFAFQVALTELWRSFGVEPQFVLGHSIGEYAALCVAGALTVHDGLRLTMLRGDMMQHRAPAGAMIGLLADRATVDELVLAADVCIAAVNGPQEYVLAGPEAAVAQATGWLDRQSIGWRRLPVDRAFHSADLAPIADAFAAEAAAVPMSPLTVPLASTVTGGLLAPGTVPGIDYLARQISQPVLFADALGALVAQDCQRFLEIGPDTVLSGVGRRASPGTVWVPTQRRGRSSVRATEHAVAELYRHGCALDWAQIVGGGGRIPLPSYPFQRRRYWIDASASELSNAGVDARQPRRPTDAGVVVPRDPAEDPTDTQPARPVATPQQPHADVLAMICDLTARQLGAEPAKVHPDRTFLELGADSLAMLRVVQEVRQLFGVTLAARDLFTDSDTPRRLSGLIADRMPDTDGAHPPRATAAPPAAPVAAAQTEGSSQPSTAEPSTIDGVAPAVVLDVLDRQLRLAGQLVTEVTGVIRQQLNMLTKLPSPPTSEPTRTTSATATSVPSAADAGRTTKTPSSPPVAEPPRPAPAPVAPAMQPRAAACDFSLYFFGSYPDQSQQDKYGAILEAVRFGDQHGFHGVWFPERHFHAFGGLFPNPVVLAATVARETSRIRINAGSVVLPLHDPIRVVEEWSVVDNLSGGRVGLCFASGWHANDFALKPDAFGRHRELMYEHLETVRALWTGASVPARSGSGEQLDVRVFPRPLQSLPPMFVAAVANPDTYRSAAVRDLGVVTNLMMQSIEQLAENIALYRRTRQEHGLDPDGGRVTVLVHTYLGEDLERVREEAYQPFCDYLRSSLSLFGGVTNSLGLRIDRDTPESDVEFLLERAYARYCEERALIGTVESADPIINRLVAAGVDEIACFVDFGVTADQMLRGLRHIDQARTCHLRDERKGSHALAPLSAAQRGMWFLEQLHPGRVNYHEPKAIRLTGTLDVTVLRGALDRVIERHAALRTVIRDVDGEAGQLVLPSVRVDCSLRIETGFPAAEAIRRVAADLTAEPIDLSTGPLLRTSLVRLGPDDHVLVLVAHHIVFDSFSTAVLVGDLAAFYRAWPAEPPALAALPISYPDHVRARLSTSDEKRRHLDYWQSVLGGAETLRLPTDRPRSATPTGRGASLVHELDADLTASIERLSQRYRATPFMTLLGGIAVVLGTFSRQDDVVLGTVLTNRPPGTENLIGLFIDSVPLRIDLAGAPTFDRVVQRIRDTSIEAFDHAGVGFDELVAAINPDRDPSRNPLFQVLVEYEVATTVDFDPPTVNATLIDVPSERAPLDLTLYLVHHGGRIECLLEYDTDLFDEASVRRLLEYVETVLRRAGTAPQATLSALTAPTSADQEAISQWSGQFGDDPVGCLHELVEQQAARTPDAIALIEGAVQVTYRDLDRRANALAWQLRDRDVRQDEFVAVCLPRGAQLIAALLGVHKAGVAVVPLDRALPESRLAFMARDSGAVVLVTDDEKLAARLGLPVLAVAGADPRAQQGPSTQVGPESLAYCIYTSGSTGEPKGVAVPHRGPTNLVRSYLRNRTAMRTLQWTSVGFDVSVQEIFTTLASGAALVVISDEDRYDPALVVDTIRRHQVQRLFMPFTPLRYLLETAPAMPSLRELVSAGEELTLTPAIRRFLATHPECVLYNEYGPTEASIIATIQRVDPQAGDKPPIGRPVDGVVVRLLDAEGRAVPVGVIGEIYLGGTGPARGYVGRPEETATAFVPDPVMPAARLYRTRDLGRWLPDGSLQYLGRVDDQVKIRGYRVEPQETQRALSLLEEVRDAAVLATRDPCGEPCLVGYVVPAYDLATQLGSRLTEQLALTLPGYLIPAWFVEVDELPVNASGKLDRDRLPEPDWRSHSDARPTTDLEQTLHGLWSAQLGMTQVPVDASFFALGGHSLTAVELVNRVRGALDVELRVADLFAAPTIRSLARRVEAATVSDAAVVTSLQQRALRLHRTNPLPAVYHVAHRITLDGDLDPDALAEAFVALARRHPALRTRFVSHDGHPVQEVLTRPPVPFDIEDLSDQPDRVDQWCKETTEQLFAPDQAPLWRARLARVGENDWLLMLVLHHLICDGWSMGIIWRDLSAFYAAKVTGGSRELPVAVGYPEYARWRTAQLDANRAALTAFWHTELDGAPLRFDLPYDRPRAGELSGCGALHRFEIPARIARLVRSAASATAGTPAAVLTAAFAVWMTDLCGQHDLVVPLSSANRLHPEHAGIVGPVGEALLVRLKLTAGARFDELVHAVTARTLAALDHHTLALGDVAQAIAADIPTPQVLFTVITTPPPSLDLPGVTTEVHSVAVAGVARTELYVVLAPVGNRIEAVFEYSTDLFDEPTVAAWERDFVAVLARVAGAPHDEIDSGKGHR